MCWFPVWEPALNKGVNGQVGSAGWLRVNPSEIMEPVSFAARFADRHRLPKPCSADAPEALLKGRPMDKR
jgi:hypothetical protein